MKITEAVFGRSLRTVSNISFLDAGIDGTGYAFWEMLTKGRASPPDYFGTIPRQPADDWQMAAYEMCGALLIPSGISPCTARPALRLVIEWPVLWSGSAKSYAAASSGKLFKQVHLIGMIGVKWTEIKGYSPILIEPADWKGQMDKPAVKARIKRAIDIDVKSHAADAVGMGLAAAGVL